MEILQEIGLTERESRVYLALLEIGITTSGALTRKSQVPNSKIYETLNKLQSKGLVTWIIKGKTKYFQASPPKQLLALIKEKEKRLENILPELELKQKKEINVKSIKIFEGLKSIRNMLLMLLQDLEKGSNFYGFSTGKSLTDKKIKEFYEWWGALRMNTGIKHHLLISNSNKREFLNSSSDKAKKAMSNAKSLRFSKISFPGDTGIINNNIILYNWDETPTTILITNENLAKEYKQFFLELWNKAEPYKYNVKNK